MRFALLAAAGMLAACCTTRQTPPSGSFALAGTSWQRTDDEDANPHGAMLEFEAARASGYTGCNRWFAPITTDGASLRFGAIGSTRMACPTEMQRDTEHHFVSALEHTRGYHLDGEELVFTGADNAQVARFACSHEPCPHG